jgi:hypothetical protein
LQKLLLVRHNIILERKDKYILIHRTAEDA